MGEISKKNSSKKSKKKEKVSHALHSGLTPHYFILVEIILSKRVVYAWKPYISHYSTTCFKLNISFAFLAKIFEPDLAEGDGGEAVLEAGGQHDAADHRGQQQ